MFITVAALVVMAARNMKGRNWVLSTSVSPPLSAGSVALERVSLKNKKKYFYFYFLFFYFLTKTFSLKNNMPLVTMPCGFDDGGGLVMNTDLDWSSNTSSAEAECYDPLFYSKDPHQQDVILAGIFFFNAPLFLLRESFFLADDV